MQNDEEQDGNTSDEQTCTNKTYYVIMNSKLQVDGEKKGQDPILVQCPFCMRK